MATMAMEKNTRKSNGKTFRRTDANRDSRMNLQNARNRAESMAEREEQAFETFVSNRVRHRLLEDWG